MDLFRKKSVDQLVAESTPLKRTMRTFDLTMLGIGAIIGTGIFVLTGKGALTAGAKLPELSTTGRSALRRRRSPALPDAPACGPDRGRYSGNRVPADH